MIVGLIATRNPTSALLRTVESLVEGGARRVIVVDDGSDHPESLAILTQLGGAPVPGPDCASGAEQG